MRLYLNIPIEIEELIAEETQARIAAQKRADEAEGECFKWQARAEAAEGNAAKMESTVGNSQVTVSAASITAQILLERDEWKRRAEAAERRLAELKHGQDEYEQFLWGNVAGIGNNDNAGALKDVKLRVLSKEVCNYCGTEIAENEGIAVWDGSFRNFLIAHINRHDCIRALKGRVAELEGKLAEAKRHIIDSLWHPGLEPPSDNGYVDVVVRGYYNEDVEKWMLGPDFRTVSDDVILEWRYPQDEGTASY